MTRGGPPSRWLALVVVGALALAAGSWGASLFIESPRDVAARAAAPSPSLIAVPVELRKVGEEIVTRGVVAATQTVEAVPQTTPAGASRALISGRVPKRADSIVAGSIVVEVSGRPVIALKGAVPAYRDLSLGDKGPDVTQVRAALASAGLHTADPAGELGPSTARAITRLYERKGYSAPPGGGLPAGEVVFVSALPASVVSTTATLGADVSAASVKIASGKLAVTADLPSGQAGLVKPGARVVVSSESLGESVKAKVVPGGSPAARPESAPDGGSVGVAIVPDSDLDPAWAGQDVRVRVVSAETVEKVLAVPVTAIVMNGSGVTEIVLVDANATTLADAHPVRIAVKVGVSGGGWVQIRPARGKAASIEPGDFVQLSAAP